jgi:hypothetical protein
MRQKRGRHLLLCKLVKHGKNNTRLQVSKLWQASDNKPPTELAEVSYQAKRRHRVVERMGRRRQRVLVRRLFFGRFGAINNIIKLK